MGIYRHGNFAEHLTCYMSTELKPPPTDQSILSENGITITRRSHGAWRADCEGLFEVQSVLRPADLFGFPRWLLIHEQPWLLQRTSSSARVYVCVGKACLPLCLGCRKKIRKPFHCANTCRHLPTTETGWNTKASYLYWTWEKSLLATLNYVFMQSRETRDIIEINKLNYNQDWCP